MSAALEPASGMWGNDLCHRLPVRIYYEDTDFSGVVYHAQYLKFFERGRTESLRSMGIHHAELAAGDDPVAFAVRKLSIEYIRAARVDDALVVETRYLPQQGPRLNIHQRLYRGAELLAGAEVQAVCMDPAGRPRRPSKAMIAAWTPYVTPAPPPR